MPFAPACLWGAFGSPDPDLPGRSESSVGFEKERAPSGSERARSRKVIPRSRILEHMPRKSPLIGQLTGREMKDTFLPHSNSNIPVRNIITHPCSRGLLLVPSNFIILPSAYSTLLSALQPLSEVFGRIECIGVRASVEPLQLVAITGSDIAMASTCGRPQPSPAQPRGRAKRSKEFRVWRNQADGKQVVQSIAGEWEQQKDQREMNNLHSDPRN